MIDKTLFTYCTICNMEDTKNAWCRCNEPAYNALITLIRTIYRDADKLTPGQVREIIQEVMRR